jgi:hypothetical protein
MQKKNEPVYCVECEDKEVQVLTKKLKPAESQPPLEMDEFIAIPSAPVSNNQQLQSNNLKRDYSAASSSSPAGLVKLLARQASPHSTHEFTTTVDVIKSKISWATDSLNTSSDVSDITQMCQMIKAASEAIQSLRLADA